MADSRKAQSGVLSTIGNLANLLPTGTVLAFQFLNPSFSNRGACSAANRYLVSTLIILCSLSCVLFSFTDSIIRDGRLFYGIATCNGFYVFNNNSNKSQKKDDKTPTEKDDLENVAVIPKKENVDEKNKSTSFEVDQGSVRDEHLECLRIRPLDYVHAFFTLLVFLTIAFSDSSVQTCFFSTNMGRNAKELLVNLPLGAAFLSTAVFSLFPTARKGIGYSDTTPRDS